MDSKHNVPRAIEYGKRLARLCHSKLTLMSVYRVKHSFELLDDLEAVKTTEQEMEQALQHLESLKTQVRRDFSGCDTYLRAGIPEDEISWTATAPGCRFDRDRGMQPAIEAVSRR
jgi:nucleotide-binding universal stress UspA family protein